MPQALRAGNGPHKMQLLAARPSSDAAMTIVEIAIGMALLGLVAAAAIAALTVLNKNAASTRVMSNAREIVQRNVEAAMGSPFTSSTEPNILKITSTSGSTWDDAGGTGQVTIYTSRDGTGPMVQGTLTRTVTTEANTPSADIRRVQFRLSYSLFNRPMTYQMTTIRAMDK